MSEKDKKLISVVVPVLNEEMNVERIYGALIEVWKNLADRYEFELIFTDNHSTDRTWEIIEKIAGRDDRVRAFRFSRDFGYQRSILTGYVKSRGDAVIQIDCDLQDPPSMIPEFIEKWEQGNQVVYGIRKSREESALTSAVRRAFYRLINLLSEDELPLDAGDFRLVDRKVVNELAKSEDVTPYLRGAIAAMGFNQTGIPYHRETRAAGKSKFTGRELVGLAIDGILNHSVFPLRVATYTGLLVSVISLILIGVYIAGKIIYYQEWTAGFTTIVILILLSLGLNALFLGVIGEYLGRIYKQVKRPPVTIIEREIGSGDRE